MKRTLKTFAIMACLGLAFLFSSCSIPGSDQYKIKSATIEYAEARLEEGEEFQWGHMERKRGCRVGDKYCKYAEVYYDVITKSGETLHKTLYLLMSEHCDSLYDVSEVKDKDWNSQKELSAQDVKTLINEVTSRMTHN